MQKLREMGYDKPFVDVERGVRDYVQNYLNKEWYIEMKWLNLFLLLMVLLSSCTFAHEVSPLFPCSEYLDEPYGTITFFSTPGMDSITQEGQLSRMDEARITNIRTDINDFFWQDYKQGYRSHLIETTQIKNYNSGKSVTGILTIGDKNHRPWNYKKAYLNYVKEYVGKYKKNISYWEMMNEINWLHDSSLYQDCHNYCSILPDIYMTIKKVNPNSTVLLSGLAGVGEECMEYLCEEGAFNYFDVFNFHTYAKPENIPIALQTAKKYMDKYNWLKPVWMTECGMPTPHIKDDADNNGYQMAMEEQAKRLTRIFLISFAYGVDKVFWYNFRSWEIDPYDEESHFGVLHSDLQPKPAFLAYQTLTRMCPDKSERPKLCIIGDCYICSWVKPNKKKVFALWCVNRSQRLNIRVEGHPEYYNYLGVKIKKPTSLTEETIYILGAQKVMLE